MIIKFPYLKGYVEVIKGEIIPHGDPELKYMKMLLEKARLWKEAYDQVGDPCDADLSYSARSILERARLSGYAMERFNERVTKQILAGTLDRERIVTLWEGWIRSTFGDCKGCHDAAVFLADWQEYNILKGE